MMFITLYTVYTICLFAFPALISAQSLLEALRGAGATSFATEIQADPTVFALYTSSSVRTVFAVQDASYIKSTPHRRQSDGGNKVRQACGTLSALEAFENPQVPIYTEQGEVVVPEPQKPNTNSRRHLIYNGTVPSIPIQLSSGLGHKVNITRGDIFYEGGTKVIHLVDDYFTLSESASYTIHANKSLSRLEQLLTQANLTDTLDATRNITVFTPNDAAFAAIGNGTNTTTAALRNLLKNHIIKDFEGYTPLLKDGKTYTSLAGSPLTITIRNNVYFVNDARIIFTNSVLKNGVAHIVDSVLVPKPVYPTPSSPPPAQYTGDAWALQPSYILVAAMALALLVQY